MTLEATPSSSPTPSAKPPVPTLHHGVELAAYVAAGFGSTVFGLAVVLAEASATWKERLQLSDSVGPLGGKALVGTVAFLASWAALAAMWRTTSPSLRTGVIIGSVLLGIGLLLTFPPIFLLFAAEEG